MISADDSLATVQLRLYFRLQANSYEAMIVTMIFGLAASEIKEDAFASWLRSSAA
jgi:hypothetical protein